MSETPVGKRRFHAFLSHAHVDKDQADHLFKWLQDVVGVPVWYDAVNMPPGATIAQALPEAIGNSRSVILLLSKQSVSRGWVQQEFNAAINHQTQFRAFRIIPIRLDDVDPPGFLQNYSNISLGAGSIGMECAANILKGARYLLHVICNHMAQRSIPILRGSGSGLTTVGNSTPDRPLWPSSRRCIGVNRSDDR
jgi:hypothetical protein